MLDQPAVSFDDLSESQLLEHLEYYRAHDPQEWAYDIECCIECLGYDPDNERVREYVVTIQGRNEKRYLYAESPGKAKYMLWLKIHDVVPAPFTEYRARLSMQENRRF